MQTKYSSKRRSLLAASIATMLTPNLLSAAPKGYGIEGQQAPELAVAKWIDGEGRPTDFTLFDHRGKFVFLELWQSWCPGCHSHGFPALQKIVAEFKDSPYFLPVGIQTTFEGYSINTEDKLTRMQARYDLPIIMGHDAGNEEARTHPNTMRRYRTGGTPWAILISPKGVVIYNDFGIDAAQAIRYLTQEIEKLA